MRPILCFGEALIDFLAQPAAHARRAAIRSCSSPAAHRRTSPSPVHDSVPTRVFSAWSAPTCSATSSSKASPRPASRPMASCARTEARDRARVQRRARRAAAQRQLLLRRRRPRPAVPRRALRRRLRVDGALVLHLCSNSLTRRRAIAETTLSRIDAHARPARWSASSNCAPALYRPAGVDPCPWPWRLLDRPTWSGLRAPNSTFSHRAMKTRCSSDCSPRARAGITGLHAGDAPVAWRTHHRAWRRGMLSRARSIRPAPATRSSQACCAVSRNAASTRRRSPRSSPTTRRGRRRAALRRRGRRARRDAARCASRRCPRAHRCRPADRNHRRPTR